MTSTGVASTSVPRSSMIIPTMPPLETSGAPDVPSLTLRPSDTIVPMGAIFVTRPGVAGTNHSRWRPINQTYRSFLDTCGRKRVAAPGHAQGEWYAQGSDVSLFAAPSGGIELSSVIRLIHEERNKRRRVALLRRCSPHDMVRRRNVEKAPPFADDEAKAVAFPFRFDPYHVLAQRERHLVINSLDARRCERKHRADAK